jgi:hypothetical protein
MVTPYQGTRCQVSTSIRDHRTGACWRGSTRRIQSATERCGRTLLLVAWDHSLAASYVFPEDILVLDEAPALTSDEDP